MKKCDDDAYEIQLAANSIEQYESQINAAIGIMGLEEPAASRFRAEAHRDVVLRSTPAPRFHCSTQFGQGRAIQAKAKACLILWAMITGSEEVLSQAYDDIREFIWSGDREIPSSKFATLDPRPLADLGAEYGVFPNLIWAGSDMDGQVYGYFRLFGAIGWTIRLGRTDSFRSTRTCLISNPLDPRVWECGAEIAAAIDVDWVASVPMPEPGDLEPVRQKLAEFLALCQRRSAQSAIGDIYDQALVKFGLSENETLSQDVASRLWNYISHRLALMIHKLPYEEKLVDRDD